MICQRWISGLLLGCMLLRSILVSSQVDHEEIDHVVANLIDNTANFYVKFLLQHFTAEFGVEGQSEKLEKIARYLWSFGEGYIPSRYLRKPYDGSLYRYMNKLLTEKRSFLYEKPFPDYDTKRVPIRQDSSQMVSYKSLVRLFFQDSLVLQHLSLDVEEMAKQKTKQLSNLAATAYRKKEKSEMFFAICLAFVDKLYQLTEEIISLADKFKRFLSNGEYLNMYFVEQYRISTQCGLMQATPTEFLTTYLENPNPSHLVMNEFYYFSKYKTKWNFRQVIEERGDLFFQPIENLKSRTVPDRSLPVWFRDFWLLAKEDAKPGTHSISVCDMMQQYFDKSSFTAHLEYEDYFAKATFLVLMKDWIESQYYEMEKAQEVIDEKVTKLVDPSSPQMRKRMEQCYLRSVLNAWYAQIGNFREQLDQNRAGALTAARRYLVKMDLWPKYAGEHDKAFEQWSDKQLGTGQQMVPQAKIKVSQRELWHCIPSKTMSMSQLDAIKNSFDADIFAEKSKNIKKSNKLISQFGKPGSVPKLRSLKSSNEWMYYRVRLAVYLAFLKPCSNTPSSLKQTFKKAPFGRLNLLGSKFLRKKNLR